MSPINLEDLAEGHPQERNAIRRLGRWLTEHKDRVLFPSVLARQLGDVDAYDLASALTLLAQAGVLVRRYKVITPSGVYADGEFDELADIPERMPDRFNRYFDTAEADVTPVFRREEI